jgi:Ca2+-binding RTX toxin-like protein
MKTRLLILAAVAVLALGVVAVAGASRLDVIRGTDGNDQLSGTPTADLIFGRGGDDSIRGGLGDDRIYGNDGNDSLRGNPGDDWLWGGPGDDSIWGGVGADREFGGPGNDALHALAFDHRVDVLDCGAGDDTAYLNGDDPVKDRTVGCEHVVYVHSTDESADE